MKASTENRTGASAAAIQHHYDVGNEFYALWLDETRTYSCGLWYGDEDLVTAQMNKIDWHLNNVGGREVRRLLEVGCGWGSTLKRALEHYQVREAVGLSLSMEQVRWCQEHSVRNADVRLENWLDHQAESPYDGIVSIGAFEHFARLDQSPEKKLEGYRDFFSFCHQCLRPGGRLSLQTIIYENASRKQFSPFFAETIFPESDLPHMFEIAQAVSGLFEIEMWRNDRAHYARTLRHWLDNLRACRKEAIAIAGTDKVSQYEKYLALMIVAFHTGTMNLARISMRRIDARSA
ncbi:MAG TPA: cyclopropane-fatty-acyl-phospholipid synthase family protein [Candidatus Solibacter sp.]|jgi:cyclopropane-fatty-acyl-phospholipid synthase|nr:cyclopropane-fatty-acyl-phospholipid synthase family protein [Candidatus Solibacter sp.]